MQLAASRSAERCVELQRASFSGSANLILNLAEVIGATLSSGGRGETLGRKHGRKTGRGAQREREVEVEVEVGRIPGHQEEECF